MNEQTTVVVVSWYSYDYLEHLIPNLLSKARAPQNVRITIVDNSAGEDSRLSKLPHSDKISIVPFAPGHSNPGVAHGRALTHALDDVSTPSALLVDPDVHVFANEWDEICRSEARRAGALAVGVPYPPWKVGKYHHFPSPIFCWLDMTRYRALGADWQALSDSRVGDAATLVRRQLGRLGGLLTRRRYEHRASMRAYAAASERLFGVFTRDAGWRLAKKAEAAGERTVLFPAEVSSGDAARRERTSREELARHYELFLWRQEPFLVHKYGSFGTPWRTERGADGEYWRRCIADLECLPTDTDAG